MEFFNFLEKEYKVNDSKWILNNVDIFSGTSVGALAISMIIFQYPINPALITLFKKNIIYLNITYFKLVEKLLTKILPYLLINFSLLFIILIFCISSSNIGYLELKKIYVSSILFSNVISEHYPVLPLITFSFKYCVRLFKIFNLPLLLFPIR